MLFHWPVSQSPKRKSYGLFSVSDISGECISELKAVQIGFRWKFAKKFKLKDLRQIKLLAYPHQCKFRRIVNILEVIVIFKKSKTETTKPTNNTSKPGCYIHQCKTTRSRRTYATWQVYRSRIWIGLYGHEESWKKSYALHVGDLLVGGG